MSADHILVATPQLGATERDRITVAPESGMIANGPEIRDFEWEFADYHETDHGIATSNGTTTLRAALHALGVGPGDHVLTTPSTFIATTSAVIFADAEVGFVDIDPRTYNIDLDALGARPRAGERVDTVIAVHFCGLPADMTRLAELTAEYDFLLVKDVAQAHDAAVEGRCVGSFGGAACFSFYPTKSMTTSEGGMITANRTDVAERAARFVNHGRVSDYEHAKVGHSFHMTNIAATISRVQLERLPGFTRARQANAAALTEYLEDSPATAPHTPPGRTHVFRQHTVTCDDIEHDALKLYLDARGIATDVYHPRPVRRQPAYEHLAVSAPVVEETATRVLSLPVHPRLGEINVERVGTAVTNYAEVTR